MLKNKLLVIFNAVIMLSVLLLFSFTVTACKDKDTQNPVLLISIDGMRPDAIHNTEHGKYLETVCSYSLTASTVYPSVTLPCHMSMFHSVEPNTHGVTNNIYTPSPDLGYGITERLAVDNKKSAIFYNWQPINNVFKTDPAVYSQFIDPSNIGWEQANKDTVDKCIGYIENNKADFTFLYLGFLDEWGHAYGWLSDEYYYALNESLALVETVISKLSSDYTVIITTDHGGHGTGHGSTAAEDMTIPLFVMGDGFAAGKQFDNASILDIAPTILDIIGVEKPTYWQGNSLRGR